MPGRRAVEDASRAEEAAVILRELSVAPAELERATGWSVKPQGACRAEVCVPLPPETHRPDGSVDVPALAGRLGMALVADDARGLWALGPESAVTGRALTTAQAPELVLPRLDGTLFSLSSLRGQKVVLVAWASWCGCRMDLHMWQALRAELHPHGLEVVTVALDSAGADAARPWIEAARPEHPAVVDVAHTVDALLGVVNVPNALWIDETGRIVRPAEPAWPGRTPQIEMMDADEHELSADHGEVAAEVRRMNIDADRYPRMLRNWVQRGAASPYVMSPDDVVAHSQPRSDAESRAAAHFELGQHLEAAGDEVGAVEHFREAHRLYPTNWTYKRQAWNLAAPESVRDVPGYEGGWLADVRALGPESYYPAALP
jgi:peroxiredoxin